MEPTTNTPAPIVVKQQSQTGNIVKIVAGGAGAVLAFLGINALIKARSLAKVQFKKSNIPNFSKSQLKEFITVCCTSGRPKSKRPKACDIHDPQRIGCQWAPKALEVLKKTNESRFFMWHPAKMAKRLFEEMKGVSLPEAVFSKTVGPIARLALQITPDTPLTTREGLIAEVGKLNVDQVRYLHNWWIDNHADGDNIYDWIQGEWGVPSAIRERAAKNMNRAGVGKKIIILRNRIKA